MMHQSWRKAVTRMARKEAVSMRSCRDLGLRLWFRAEGGKGVSEPKT